MCVNCFYWENSWFNDYKLEHKKHQVLEQDPWAWNLKIPSNKPCPVFLQWFKGPVSVVSSDPPCNDDNARFTTGPWKALSHQEWIIPKNPTESVSFLRLIFV